MRKLLENASDYEHGSTQLTLASHQKILVEKLKERGGGVNKALLPGNKRKSTCNVLTLLKMKVKFWKKELMNAKKSSKQRRHSNKLRTPDTARGGLHDGNHSCY